MLSITLFIETIKVAVNPKFRRLPPIDQRIF